MSVNPLSFITRFFGRTVSEGAAFAMGAATAPAIRPLLQDLANETWSLHPVRPPDAFTLAQGVAQGQVDPAQAAKWAAENGYGTAQFQALIDIANIGPGVATAFDLWRRNVTDQAGFVRAVKRLGLEQEWIDDLVKLKINLLNVEQLANAIHRGLVDDQGLLLGVKPGAGKVPAYPVYPIDALVEAMGQGIDHDRLGVLVGLTGLPMGSHEAAQATFRGVIDKADFYRAIAEGNTRNEWADAIFEQSRQIPTPTNYVEARLRGWIDDAAMYAGAARHGMTPADTDTLFLIHGRPPSWHQVFIGLARGGVYNGPTNQIAPPFLKALEESDLRPEWYNLLWASRYNYPTAFVLRTLTQSGDLTGAETEQILLYEGWEPTLAKTVSTRWAGSTAGATGPLDPHVKKAEGQLWTALHKAYLDFETSDAAATNELTALGALDPSGVLSLWQRERGLIRKELSSAQIHKAYTVGALDLAQATTLLQNQGMSAADINTLLHS